MCKWGTHKKINVIRRANPYVEDGWHEINVDSCIADKIQEMNNLGVITLNCCCGHGKSTPNVLVSKGSEILLKIHGYDYRHATKEDMANPFNTLAVNLT